MSDKQTQPGGKRPERERKDQVPEAGKPRDGRRFAVSQHKGKARGKVRYIETNEPGKGCRFL